VIDGDVKLLPASSKKKTISLRMTELRSARRGGALSPANYCRSWNYLPYLGGRLVLCQVPCNWKNPNSMINDSSSPHFVLGDFHQSYCETLAEEKNHQLYHMRNSTDNSHLRLKVEALKSPVTIQNEKSKHQIYLHDFKVRQRD
jgi:hypothetical protein